MTANHGITHEIMDHLVVIYDATGRYSDKILFTKSVKSGFVVMLRNV